MGLGLTISNELVRKLNDDDPDYYIKVESALGQGTTFSFEVPLTDPAEIGSLGNIFLESTINIEEKHLAKPMKIHKFHELCEEQ